METTQIEWYTKQEAGVRLGTTQQPMSARRVLELAKEGKFQSERFHDPETGQMTTRIHAGSLERYLDERGIRRTAPVSAVTSEKPAPPWTAVDGITKRMSELVSLARELRNGDANNGAPSARLYLTLEEAADYSGLPASILVHFIASKALKAMNVGRRRGGQWRIRRLDLDQFAGVN